MACHATVDLAKIILGNAPSLGQASQIWASSDIIFSSFFSSSSGGNDDDDAEESHLQVKLGFLRHVNKAWCKISLKKNVLRASVSAYSGLFGFRIFEPKLSSELFKLGQTHSSLPKALNHWLSPSVLSLDSIFRSRRPRVIKLMLYLVLAKLSDYLSVWESKCDFFRWLKKDSVSLEYSDCLHLFLFRIMLFSIWYWFGDWCELLSGSQSAIQTLTFHLTMAPLSQVTTNLYLAC